jgi:hypothetical protein
MENDRQEEAERHPPERLDYNPEAASNTEILHIVRVRQAGGWAEDFEHRLKPDGVPEASFPCERQQAGVGPAALEERWSRDSRGGVRRVRWGRITTPAGDGVLAVRRLAHR